MRTSSVAKSDNEPDSRAPSHVDTAAERSLESGFWSDQTDRTAIAVDSRQPAPLQPLLRKGPRAIVATSRAMRRVQQVLQPLACAEVSVMLIGETGTGKDVLAHTLHNQSPRRAGPFVVFDCGAVSAGLAESELLGHERGAFTGAVASHPGAFERAHGGTLFLDEIGELPLDLQTRLLRLLGNGSVRRVGGTQDRPLDVRIVAATNRDLRAEVAAKRFRRDLYFRLAAAVVQVPPLRERAEDISALACELLKDLGHSSVRIAPAATDLLTRRTWRGNVRELKNALACAVAFLDGDLLEPHHFALPPDDEPLPETPQLALAGLKLESIERAAIEQTLHLTGNNKARAAELLGIAPSTLYERLKRYQRPAET